MYYVAKYEESQQYGGSEEGSWYYDQGTPEWRVSIPVPFEELAYKLCRYFNRKEHKRRETECKYGYTSVLSYRDTFYTYTFSDTFIPQAYPQVRPHYE
jgi:hypothetical protein